MAGHDEDVGEIEELARINWLPDDLIGCILSRLSIREAGRTSVLSRHWRHKWKCMPDLSFTRSDFQKSFPRGDRVYHHDLVNVLNNVLANHTGTIRSFVFNTDLKRCSEMDSWIHALNHYNIKEIVLSFEQSLPPSLFHCQHLTSLKLSACKLWIPPQFGGFPNLKFLSLLSVSGHDVDFIQRLTSSSPLLSELIVKPYNSTDVVISAPHLLKLEISAHFSEFRLANASNLRYLSVILRKITHRTINANDDGQQIRNFIKFLGGLSELEYLKIGMYFLQLLSIHAVIPSQPMTLSGMKTLKLEYWSCECLKATEFALFLIKSCPCLQNLDITFSYYPNYITHIGDFWNHTNCLSGNFNCLEVLKLHMHENVMGEMKFLEYIFKNSPMLADVELRFYPDRTRDKESKCRLREAISAMPRVSGLDKIWFLGLR